MIVLLLGLLTWGLGVAYVVYAGHRDHSELTLVSSGDAGGAVHLVERAATLGPAALRGAPQTLPNLEMETIR